MSKFSSEGPPNAPQQQVFSPGPCSYRQLQCGSAGVQPQMLRPPSLLPTVAILASLSSLLIVSLRKAHIPAGGGGSIDAATRKGTSDCLLGEEMQL